MASQMVVALVRPGLLLPLPAAISGAVALGMIFFLRLQNPGLGAHLRQHIATPPASLDALVREVRLDEGLTLRATRIEMVAGLAVGAFFLIPMVTAPNMALGVGWALATAYGLYVAAIMSRHRPRPLPDGLGFNDSLAFYRTTLESRRSLLRKMWIWYALPFTPAVLFIAIGGALVAAERGRPLWPVAILPLVALGIGLLIHRSSQDMVRKLDVRIDALASAEERSR
jgi:hypothetical protein